MQLPFCNTAPGHWWIRIRNGESARPMESMGRFLYSDVYLTRVCIYFFRESYGKMSIVKK